MEQRRRQTPNHKKWMREYMRIRHEMETGICRDRDMRLRIYQEAGGACALCGTVVAFDEMTIDHVTALARGGEDVYENLQLAHHSCNARKGAGDRARPPMKKATA